MRKHLHCFASVAALSVISAQATAQTLVSRHEPTGEINLSIRSVEEFQSDMNLDIIDPDKAQSAVPAEVPKDGSTATDPATGVTVTATFGEVSIRSVHDDTTGHVSYVLGLRDKETGAALLIHEKEITVQDSSSTELPFDLQPFDEAKLPASVIVLVDQSGSMSTVMDEVVQTANWLFDTLPDHISCQAVLFAGEQDWYGDRDEPCTANDVALPDNVEAGGGTNLFGALRATYAELGNRNDQTQKVVIVLTDGNPTDEEIAGEVTPLKLDTYTIFIWLGMTASDAEEVFRPISDVYVSDPNGAWQHIESYLKIFSDAVEKQSVVTIESPK